MAESKNNRKKGQKRSPSHSAPPGYVAPEKPKAAEAAGSASAAKEKEKPQGSFIRRHMLILHLFGLILLIAGLFAGYYKHMIFGYPVSVAGALIGFYCARDTDKYGKVSRICYAVYAGFAIVRFVAELL